MSYTAVIRSRPVFSMGGDTLEVPMTLHTTNRQRLCDALKSELGGGPDAGQNHFVVLRGGEQLSQDSTDAELVFRQESFFHWLFGVLEPDCQAAMHVATGRTHLFVPAYSESYAVYCGEPETHDSFRQKYAVDAVHTVDELGDVLNSAGAHTLLLLRGTNTDSGVATRAFEPPANLSDKVQLDYAVLHPVMSELRVFKTQAELAVLRYSARISSQAHCAVMRYVQTGVYEYQVEAFFDHHCYTHGGMRHTAYTCICGSGPNSAILHYGHAGRPNERQLADGDMCLFDMGGEYYCYGSDITCSYPMNGKFTEKQRAIYEAVLAARNAVLEAAKPGVSWTDMHLLAERIILQHLINAGILHGDLCKMMELRLGAVFQPHGLGHMLGCDVHDVGGYYPEPRPDVPARSTVVGLSRLRTARILYENMYVTVEPGCYFIDFLLDRALADPNHRQFINAERLAEFRGFGGVRIEDDVLITATGTEVFNNVPRTVDEIETWMAGKGKDWIAANK